MENYNKYILLQLKLVTMSYPFLGLLEKNYSNAHKSDSHSKYYGIIQIIRNRENEYSVYRGIKCNFLQVFFLLLLLGKLNLLNMTKNIYYNQQQYAFVRL